MEKEEERKKQARLAKARVLASLDDARPRNGLEDDLNIAEYDDDQKASDNIQPDAPKPEQVDATMAALVDS